ncbi:hypothetical protein O3P69_010914 [Scylla paramamosain]|uniref:Uncharacterized protein n=1 Tax=Scylla paramamosain TaxID=85552 RepID=A0AAW0SDD0_SCYPA
MQRHTQNSSITFEQPMLICAEAHQSSQARRDQVISAEEWRVGWQELEALRGSEEEMKWKMNLGAVSFVESWDIESFLLHYRDIESFLLHYRDIESFLLHYRDIESFLLHYRDIESFLLHYRDNHLYKLFVATYEDLDKMLLAYTTPMDTALYWCILTNMIGLASILFFADQLQRCYIPMGRSPVSMGVAGWYVLSALLQQSEDLLGCGTGSNTYPISSAAWVTYRVGCGVSLIVYTSYSATLVSHLAVEQSVTLPFSNLQELSRQSGWDAGCNNNDLFKEWAKRAAAQGPEASTMLGSPQSGESLT